MKNFSGSIVEHVHLWTFALAILLLLLLSRVKGLLDIFQCFILEKMDIFLQNYIVASSCSCCNLKQTNQAVISVVISNIEKFIAITFITSQICCG